MKNLYIPGLVFFLVCSLVVGGCGPGVNPEEVPEGEKTAVVITDGEGYEVEVACPVEKIISMNPAASEAICVLGGLEKIIGRSAPSIFPPSLKDIKVVAESSNRPNMELIIESQPDLVVADSNIVLDSDIRERLITAGIPCLIYTTSDVENLPHMIEDLGQVLGKMERAQQLIDFCNGYFALIEERTAGLDTKDRPQVYYEWHKPYYSTNSTGPAHYRMNLAGGINVAADEPVRSPTLAPEWIAEKNPDIIVRMCSRGDSVVEMEELYQEVMERAGLSKTSAVQENRVHIMSWDISTGIRTIIGNLYLAQWFHPELFIDMDPEDIHQELLNNFYDLELEDAYVYP